MSSHRQDEAPFTWPPEPADLECIDVVDVGKAASVPDALAPASTVFRRLRRRRTHKRSRPRATTGRRTRARDAWLLLASGVLIGATLPGLIGTRTSALSSQQTGVPAINASPLVGTAGDGAALRAMQAMLRGDSPAPAQGVNTRLEPARLESHSGPARAASFAPVAAAPVASAAVSSAKPASARVTSTAVASAPGRRSSRTVGLPVAVRVNPNARDVAVRRVLQAYERAWTRMDTHTARALWPSADARTLQAEFGPVSEQRLQLAACDVGLSGDRALAICLGTLRYRPRSGGGVPRVERGRWEFELERADAGWQISSVDRP